MLARWRRSLLVRTLALIPPRMRWVYLAITVVDRVNCSLLLNIILAFILKDAIDAAVRGEMAALERAAALAGLSLFVGVPISVATSFALKWSYEVTARSARATVFEHLVAARQASVDGWHSGDVVSRATNDFDTTLGLYNQLQGLFFALVHGIVAMVAVYLLDWRCGVLVTAMGLITLGANTAFVRPLRRWSNRVQERLGGLTERLSDLLRGLSVTKMHHLEGRMHGEYTGQNDQLVSAVLRRGFLSAVSGAIDTLIYHARTVGLLGFGLFLLVSGDPIAVGSIAAIVRLQNNADFLFITLGSVVTGIQSSLAGASRLFELLDEPTEDLESGRAGRLTLAPNEQGDEPWVGDGVAISTRGLRFAYGTEAAGGPERREVLGGIDLDVRAGHTVALVGPSGGGKTTVIKILLGLYAPDDGQVRIAGEPIETHGLRELRAAMAYVPQEASVFHGTIAENIGHGSLRASRAQIEEAAQRAHAHEFIAAQPAGYDTVVGERGARLSGGQRQCIAIARAVLRDAPILLLDEATSALDSESERLVQEGLSSLMRGRTTVAVAHRLSTVEQADMIFVIDRGVVAEAGTPRELLSRAGLYRQLHDAQFGRT